MFNYGLKIHRSVVQVDLIDLWTVLIPIDAWNWYSTHYLGKDRHETRPSTHYLGKNRQKSYISIDKGTKKEN